MNEKQQQLARLDHQLYICETSEAQPARIREAQSELRRYLKDLCVNLPDDSNKKTIADFIDHIEEHESISTKRDASLVLLRTLGIRELLPDNNSTNQIHQKLVTLIARSCPDITGRFDISSTDQTYKQIANLTSIHEKLCENWRQLATPLESIAAATANIQQLHKLIGNKTNRSYFHLWGFDLYATRVRTTLNILEKIERVDPDSMCDMIERLSEDLKTQIHELNRAQRGIVSDVYLKFAEHISTVVTQYLDAHRASFQCRLQLVSDHVEKRFPLIPSTTKLRILVPAINIGPGRAYDVRALLLPRQENVMIEASELQLGTIDAGRFVIPLSLSIGRAMDEIKIEFVLSWRSAGSSEMVEHETAFVLLAQSSNTNWVELEGLQPYTSGIAIGAEFVGRHECMRRILARMRAKTMQSCYITGQKRVGKTSLANAVANTLRSDPAHEFLVIQLENGEFAHATGEETLRALGQELEFRIADALPKGISWPPADFGGSLAPLSRLLHLVEQHRPKLRLVVILDEFDDINYDLYRFGSLADTFFNNLRTLSSKPNVAFILVGGERMSFLINAQGEKLNRFERESLDTFDQEKEWEEYEQLIRKPVEDKVRWYDSAIRKMYAETGGHPYFTKLLCATVFNRCIYYRDSEVIAEDVERALGELVQTTDVNAFAHYWKDGIQGAPDQVETVSLKRCRVLAAYARTRRMGEPSRSSKIAEQLYSRQITADEADAILGEFCRRRIMEERGGEVRVVVALFEHWLVERGVNDLIADRLGDELAELRRREDDQAYVTALELQNAVSAWPTFRSRTITTEDVRAWLNQIPGNIQQRLLFKLLQNLRFVSESEVREKFRGMHPSVLKDLPPSIRKKRTDRRQDILLTYLSGPGKSGVKYANLYAEENIIAPSSVVELSDLGAHIFDDSPRAEEVRAIIIVDDIAASGNALATQVAEFFGNYRDVLEKRGILVFVVVVVATKDGEKTVRHALSQAGHDKCDLRVCEFLEPQHTAFSDGLGFWASEEEKMAAKSLCQDLGRKLRPKEPLGYHGQSLLVVFQYNCPNNSLPILYSPNESWRPLFPRKS